MGVGKGGQLEVQQVQDPKKAPVPGADAQKENALKPETDPKLVLERGKQATEVAKSTTEVYDPILDVKDVPDNYWGQQFRKLQERVRNGEQSSGIGTNLMGVGMLLAAKWSKYADLIPGKFEEKLETTFKSKTFTPEELAEMEKNKKLSQAEKDKKRSEALDSASKEAKNDKDAKKDPRMEKESTEYLCAALGFPSYDNVTDLAARLKNSTKTFTKKVGKEVEETEIPYYKSATLAEITKTDAPEGTVLVIVPKFMEGNKVVARRKGPEFTYEFFDAAEGKLVTFQLTDKASPIQLNPMNMLVAFIPSKEMEKKEKKNSEEFVAKISGFEAQTKKDDLAAKDLTFDVLKAKAEAAYAGAIAVKGELEGRAEEKSKAIYESMARAMENTRLLYEKYAVANDKKIVELGDAAKVAKTEWEAYQKDYDAAVAKAKTSNNPADITARDQKKPEFDRKKAEADKVDAALKAAQSAKTEIMQKIPLIVANKEALAKAM